MTVSVGKFRFIRLDVQRASDALISLEQHASIDVIRFALGNTGPNSASPGAGMRQGTTPGIAVRGNDRMAGFMKQPPFSQTQS